MDTKKNWKVAILFICVFATKISAQTPFTKRQIYDFNPGDVMQTTNKYTQTPGPPIYETDSITERWTGFESTRNFNICFNSTDNQSVTEK